MKNRSIVDKVMHFLMHNSFLFTVIVMCFVHATLLIIMGLAKLTPMVQFNILSVIVYLFCILLCRFGHYLPVYISIILEVTAYTIYSTYFIGLNAGSYCFLFSIIPIIIYFGCFLFKGHKRLIVVLMLVLNFAAYVVLYLKFGEAKPFLEISPATKTTLIIFSMFVMVFAVIFYNFIYIYSSESMMSDLESKNRQLSTDATEDALTGLLNRRGFLPLMKKCMENEQSKYFCVAFCDIDNFKRVNDSFGHDAGDEVLRHITALIKKEMQGCDICRWGGEETVILMKDYDMTVAKEKMEYVRKSIETSPTVFFNRRINVTVTIGLEENKDSYKEAEDIIKKADSRMYYGKQHGKNIVIYSDNED